MRDFIQLNLRLIHQNNVKSFFKTKKLYFKIFQIRVGQVARASGRLECEVTSLGHSARLVAISKMSKHSSCLEISDEPDKPNKHDETEKNK